MILTQKNIGQIFLNFYKCTFLDVNDYKIQTVHWCIQGCVL